MAVMCRAVFERARLLACFLASVGLAPVSSAQDERPYLRAAEEAGRWLATVAVETESGLSWPADPARDDGASWTLYQGTPGVVLFHLELASAAGDERALEVARRGADGLLGWCSTSLDGSGAGLYTGSAGVGFALAETWRATGDERFREGCLSVLAHLHATAERTEHGARWSEVTDVIAGDAGVGFFLLDSARRFDRREDLELAVAVGHDLLARADDTEKGLSWAMSPTFPRRMPNFSHGTAGVATFLAALHGATGEEEFLIGAVAGAERVLALAAKPAQAGFRVHHHSPDGEELFYLGWCHGPTGTSVLFRTNRTSLSTRACSSGSPTARRTSSASSFRWRSTSCRAPVIPTSTRSSWPAPRSA